MDKLINSENLKDDLINCYKTLNKYMCYIENERIELVHLSDIERIAKEKHIKKFYVDNESAKEDFK